MIAGKQHVELYRKLALRRRVLSQAMVGPAYVPFLGAGEIARELYAPRSIFGADIDAERVQTARGRLPGGAVLKVADCTAWPFPDIREPFALADFDAYADPWPALTAFWQAAEKADPIVLFLTDGRLVHVGRPMFRLDGKKVPLADGRKLFSTYPAHCRARLERLVAPWEVRDWQWYRRNKMLYAAAVVGSPVIPHAQDTPSGNTPAQPQRQILLVEEALYTAAINGNVKAMEMWLYHRAPERWQRERAPVPEPPSSSPGSSFQMPGLNAHLFAALVAFVGPDGPRLAEDTDHP